MLPRAIELVRDFQPFCEARFSRRELIRFVRITLDQAMVTQMACKVTHQANHFSDADLEVRGIRPVASFYASYRISLIQLASRSVNGITSSFVAGRQATHFDPI